MEGVVHGVTKSRTRLSDFPYLVCLSRSAYLEFVHFVRNYQNWVSQKIGFHSCNIELCKLSLFLKYSL